MSTTEVAEDIVHCDRCGERVRFLDGVYGPARWQHIRTGSHVCQPVCAKCGGPGTYQIGRYDLDGGQVPVFRRDHWECADCAKANGELRIEHA
jgi:hypothetical protein